MFNCILNAQIAELLFYNMKFNYFARSYIKMNTDSVEYIQNVLLFRAIDEISNNFKTLRTN